MHARDLWVWAGWGGGERASEQQDGGKKGSSDQGEKEVEST